MISSPKLLPKRPALRHFGCGYAALCVCAGQFLDERRVTFWKFAEYGRESQFHIINLMDFAAHSSAFELTTDSLSVRRQRQENFFELAGIAALFAEFVPVADGNQFPTVDDADAVGHFLGDA